MLTIPVSSASIERTFSQLRLIKSPLRTCLSDETLESCLLIHQEKDLSMSDEIVKLIDAIKIKDKDEEREEKNLEEDDSKTIKQSIVHADQLLEDNVANSYQLLNVQPPPMDSRLKEQEDLDSDKRLFKAPAETKGQKTTHPTG